MHIINPPCSPKFFILCNFHLAIVKPNPFKRKHYYFSIHNRLLSIFDPLNAKIVMFSFKRIGFNNCQVKIALNKEL